MSLNSIGYRGIISIAILTPIAVVLAFCDAKAMDDIDIPSIDLLREVCTGDKCQDYGKQQENVPPEPFRIGT